MGNRLAPDSKRIAAVHRMAALKEPAREGISRAIALGELR